MTLGDHSNPDRTPSTEVGEVLRATVDWAEREVRRVRTQGKPLAFWQVAEARQVGVRKPERVRVLAVDTLPRPDHPHPALRGALTASLLGPEAQAVALGYNILIPRSKVGERRLLRHELRHVAQCEQAGGLSAFLVRYLDEVVRFGYWNAPLEIDARSHEQTPNPSVPRPRLRSGIGLAADMSA